MKMPHWPVPLGSRPIDLELSRISKLLNLLGNPQNNLPPVIHVAGTNGKGSTTAFLKAIFQAAGYRVHTYNSPHLVRFNERIGILGNEIEDDFLYQILEECRIISEANNTEVTFFEGTTAAAFLAFSRVKADILILEVGLGGRLDATNVIEKPIMSIITSISIDHTEFLGDNIIKIAREKAGIIKPNCPCVITQQYPESMEILMQIAQMNNSVSYSYEYDWIVYSDHEHNLIYEANGDILKFPKPSLQGAHQYLNAGNAITAVLNLPEFKINHNHIAQGISQTHWPARIQCLTEGVIISKIAKDWQIWVDGAHNDSGAYVLSLWLSEQKKMPTYMIFGMTKGRNCQEFLTNFIGKVDYLIGVLIEAEPSSYSGEFVSDCSNQIGIPASAANSIDEALAMLTPIAGPARIIVCGSLYLAGDILYQNQKRRIKLNSPN
jgi:dihydrofolate synthase / folylpolyglutamate synthase